MIDLGRFDFWLDQIMLNGFDWCGISFLLDFIGFS